MSTGAVTALGCFVCCALSLAGQTATNLKDVQTIYLNSFGSKPGASELRDRVAAEIEKTHTLRIVASPAEADAVLGGEGEVWVKGHYSMNPRERSLNDAQTIYAGYLSVELQGKKNDTLWSYLVTPHSVSRDVNHDLAKVVVKKLTDAIHTDASHGDAGK
ncbi:MAG: hypothetical protein ABSB15_20100 [Bryobacteraceae bacterium]|jgi:hypothetical protein